ncbi:MAG: hypothetical protein J0L66_16120 [Cytophagales bacterium]|nr:hypothetical protein [Cytophagales bacterium]
MKNSLNSPQWFSKLKIRFFFESSNSFSQTTATILRMVCPGIYPLPIHVAGSAYDR